MSLRDALEQSRFLTLAIIAALAWTVFSITRVLGQFNFWAPEPVGMTPGAGIIGVLVMLVGVTLALALLSGFGHSEPTADTWPPDAVDEDGSGTDAWPEGSVERDDSTSERLPSESSTAE